MNNKLFVRDFSIRIVTGLVAGTLFWLAFVYFPSWAFSLVLLGILAQIIIFEWCRLFQMNTPLFWMLMPFYPILPFALLLHLNYYPLYHELLLILFLLVFSHDTGSYIIGNIFGKHKILPYVSPSKTWEGFFGGYLFATISLLLYLWYDQDKPISLWFVLTFTFTVCGLALLGDLFESWLKRRAHIKDTSNILPGHGGFLDRFDGILFAVFFFFLLRTYLVTVF